MNKNLFGFSSTTDHDQTIGIKLDHILKHENYLEAGCFNCGD